MSPFNKTFTYNFTPNSTKNLNPEIEQLMNSSRYNTCLQGRTSALGQEAFKILRDTNLMRFQQASGEKMTQRNFNVRREEMQQRQRDFSDCQADYHNQLRNA